MKSACVILTVLILIALITMCVMVKFATDITMQERRREYTTGGGGGVYRLAKSMGVISLRDTNSQAMSERFPYVAAIMKNDSTSWTFSCFGCVVLVKWMVTSAHCRHHGATHRVLIYYDFVKNNTVTYPILFWRLHEKYNHSLATVKYDIAVAKLNVDISPFEMKAAISNQRSANSVLASVWKTVSSMDKRLFLTNDFDKFALNIVPFNKCSETYHLKLDESQICVDMSHYKDCFVHEFGPLFFGDKVVGVLAVKPRDCDVKFAIFTNVSYYFNWIMKSTHSTYYG